MPKLGNIRSDVMLEIYGFPLKCTNSILCAPFNWANSETSVKMQPNSRRFLTSLTLPSVKKKLQRRLVWNGSRMCSNSRDDPSTPCFEFWENLSWMERLFFSYLTLPMERSQPIENNKVRNLTLMKEMRERKTRSLGTSVHGGKKERKDEERGRQRLKKQTVLCVCLRPC